MSDVAALDQGALVTDEPQGWGEPLPPWCRPADLPPFPVDALAPALGDYVRGLAGEIQVPVDLAGSIALGVLAACVGGRVRVRVRSGWTEPTNLYVVPVADPASRKSAVVAACREPLAEAERRLREDAISSIGEQRTAKELAERHAETLKDKAAKTGNASDIAEAQAAVARAEEMTVQRHPRLTAQDATPEALVSLLADQGGRIAVISAEAGPFDALSSRYTKSSNIEALLQAHSGDAIQVDRRGREPELVDHPALTFVVSIQPYVLRALVSRDEYAGRGLLARPLWVLVPDVVGTRRWEAPTMPEATRDAYRRLIVDLATAAHSRSDVVTLTPSRDAYEIIGELYGRVESLLGSDSDMGAGLIRSWGGKLVGATVRIAGCLHAARWPTLLDSDSTAPMEIEAETMRSAVRIGEYLQAHAMVALADVEDEASRDARVLLEYLAGRDRAPFRIRDVQRGGPKALRRAGRLVPVIDRLIDLGWIRSVGSGSDYILHPNAGDILDRMRRATGATGATPGGDRCVSAAQAGVSGRGDLSPTGATAGDSQIVSDVSPGVASYGRQQLSPRVAHRGDTTGLSSVGDLPGRTPSARGGVAPVAPVAPDSIRACVTGAV